MNRNEGGGGDQAKITPPELPDHRRSPAIKASKSFRFRM